MQNPDQWSPSKYAWHQGQLRASSDPREVSPASRLAVDLVARCYQEHLPAFARGRLLDLGCGKVPLYHAYKRLVTETVCVDWGNSLHGKLHLDAECDLAQPLPFGPASFDTIILSDVLEHIAEPAALWGEMARVLRPGGHVFVNVPFLYWLHEEPYDFYRYTEFALRRFAQRAGFEVVVLERTGGAAEVLVDVIGKTAMAWRWLGPRLAGLLHRTGRLLLKTRRGQNFSRTTARHFPLGYFLVARRNG